MFLSRLTTVVTTLKNFIAWLIAMGLYLAKAPTRQQSPLLSITKSQIRNTPIHLEIHWEKWSYAFSERFRDRRNSISFPMLISITPSDKRECLWIFVIKATKKNMFNSYIIFYPFSAN